MHVRVLSLGLLASACAAAAVDQQLNMTAPEVREMLQDVSEPALHEAMHELYPAFRDGVFDSNRNAAEAVSSDDPSLASRIVAAASHADNLKRQFPGSSNTTTTTSSSTSTFIPTTSSSSSIVTPTSTPTPTTTPTPTSITTPSSIFTPTPSSTSTPPPAPVTSTATPVITRTTAAGQSTVSSTNIVTSTLPNGSPSTLTNVAIITPTIQGNGAQTTSSKTQTAKPSLVTGNAAPHSFVLGREAVALVAGAAGVAWLF